MMFTFSVPDHIFINPATGETRWLIRECMKERLPNDVRLNSKFGVQSADRVLRLRRNAGEVVSTLNELSQGAAAEYLDVDHMRQTWKMIQEEDTPKAYVKSGSILLRGIMAGIFVNNFYN
jgi:asparagine synthase (glutamine-hydrolysing)